MLHHAADDGVRFRPGVRRPFYTTCKRGQLNADQISRRSPPLSDELAGCSAAAKSDPWAQGSAPNYHTSANCCLLQFKLLVEKSLPVAFLWAGPWTISRLWSLSRLHPGAGGQAVHQCAGSPTSKSGGGRQKRGRGLGTAWGAWIAGRREDWKTGEKKKAKKKTELWEVHRAAQKLETLDQTKCQATWAKSALDPLLCLSSFGKSVKENGARRDENQSQVHQHKQDKIE